MYPPPRIRCTITKINDTEFCLFGGITVSEGFKNEQSKCRWNDIWILKQINTTTFQWMEVTSCSGEIPTPRYGHSANLLTTNEGTFLVIIGGNGLSGLLNDVYTLNLNTFVWKRIKPNGELPPPRYYHSAINTADDQILVFAGNTNDRESNDSYLLTAQPEWRWTKLAAHNPPPKRYQHSMFKYGQDSYIAFGGIQRLAAFQDVHMLHLGDENWEEWKADGENESETLSHAQSMMLNNKIFNLNFDEIDKSGEIKILSIDEETKKGTWSSVEIKGDLIKGFQFYTLVETSNPLQYLIINLANKSKVTIFNLEMLELTQTVHLNLATLLKTENNTGEIHKCSLHFAGKPIVPIEDKTSFIQLEKLAKQISKYPHITLYVTAPSSSYKCIRTQDEWETFKYKHNKLVWRVYIAETHQDRTTKEERLKFLNEEVSAMNIVTENVSFDDFTKRFSKKTVVGAGMTTFSINTEATELGQPLPLLFAKPNKLSLLRVIHKKFRRFEKWGFEVERLSEKPGFFAGLAILLKWLFIGICGFYFLFRKSMTLPTRLFVLFMMVFNIGTIAMPLLGQLLAPKNVFQLPGRFTPLLLYFIFAFSLAAIEKHKKKKTSSNYLSKYAVTTYQRLITGEYGKRRTSAQDVFFGITNKESVVKDRWYYKFMAYIVPVLAAILHTVVMVYYYATEDKSTLYTFPTILEFVMNFISTLVYATALGVCWNVYKRQARHIEYFSYLMSMESARAHQLPALPMNRIKNILAWMKLRNHMRGHEFLPLVTADAMFRLSLVFLVALWIIFVLLMIAESGINAISVFILFHIILSAFYIISASSIGRVINTWQQKHSVMLYKEMLKLKIETQQQKHDEKVVQKLKCCSELLENLIEIIDTQDPVFSLFGFHIEESGAKALTYFLGIGLSLTVIFTARKEIDLELEV